MVARVEPSAPGFDSWSAIFPKAADLVISASYNPLHLPLRAGVLHLRAEAWAGSDDDARAITDKANIFLTMFRSAEVSVGSAGSDADVKALFESLQVRQEGSRAVFSAVLPGAVLRKLGESSEQTEPAPTNAATRWRRSRRRSNCAMNSPIRESLQLNLGPARLHEMQPRQSASSAGTIKNK